MNAADRKKASDAVSALEALKSQIETIGNSLRELADDEQGKFDNMPDSLQQGERGQAIEQAATTLSEAADACEEGDLNTALEALGNLEAQ